MPEEPEAEASAKECNNAMGVVKTGDTCKDCHNPTKTMTEGAAEISEIDNSNSVLVFKVVTKGKKPTMSPKCQLRGTMRKNDALVREGQENTSISVVQASKPSDGKEVFEGYEGHVPLPVKEGLTLDEKLRVYTRKVLKDSEREIVAKWAQLEYLTEPPRNYQEIVKIIRLVKKIGWIAGNKQPSHEWPDPEANVYKGELGKLINKNYREGELEEEVEVMPENILSIVDENEEAGSARRKFFDIWQRSKHLIIDVYHVDEEQWERLKNAKGSEERKYILREADYWITAVINLAGECLIVDSRMFGSVQDAVLEGIRIVVEEGIMRRVKRETRNEEFGLGGLGLGKGGRGRGAGGSGNGGLHEDKVVEKLLLGKTSSRYAGKEERGKPTRGRGFIFFFKIIKLGLIDHLYLITYVGHGMAVNDVGPRPGPYEESYKPLREHYATLISFLIKKYDSWLCILSQKRDLALRWIRFAHPIGPYAAEHCYLATAPKWLVGNKKQTIMCMCCRFCKAGKGVVNAEKAHWTVSCMNGSIVRNRGAWERMLGKLIDLAKELPKAIALKHPFNAPISAVLRDPRYFPGMGNWVCNAVLHLLKESCTYLGIRTKNGRPVVHYTNALEFMAKDNQRNLLCEIVYTVSRVAGEFENNQIYGHDFYDPVRNVQYQSTVVLGYGKGHYIPVVARASDRPGVMQYHATYLSGEFDLWDIKHDRYIKVAKSKKNDRNLKERLDQELTEVACANQPRGERVGPYDGFDSQQLAYVRVRIYCTTDWERHEEIVDNTEWNPDIKLMYDVCEHKNLEPKPKCSQPTDKPDVPKRPSVRPILEKFQGVFPGMNPTKQKPPTQLYDEFQDWVKATIKMRKTFKDQDVCSIPFSRHSYLIFKSGIPIEDLMPAPSVDSTQLGCHNNGIVGNGKKAAGAKRPAAGGKQIAGGKKKKRKMVRKADGSLSDSDDGVCGPWRRKRIVEFDEETEAHYLPGVDDVEQMATAAMEAMRTWARKTVNSQSTTQEAPPAPQQSNGNPDGIREHGEDAMDVDGAYDIEDDIADATKDEVSPLLDPDCSWLDQPPHTMPPDDTFAIIDPLQSGYMSVPLDDESFKALLDEPLPMTPSPEDVSTARSTAFDNTAALPASGLGATLPSQTNSFKDISQHGSTVSHAVIPPQQDIIPVQQAILNYIAPSTLVTLNRPTSPTSNIPTQSTISNITSTSTDISESQASLPQDDIPSQAATLINTSSPNSLSPTQSSAPVTPSPDDSVFIDNYIEFAANTHAGGWSGDAGPDGGASECFGDVSTTGSSYMAPGNDHAARQSSSKNGGGDMQVGRKMAEEAPGTDYGVSQSGGGIGEELGTDLAGRSGHGSMGDESVRQLLNGETETVGDRDMLVEGMDHMTLVETKTGWMGKARAAKRLGRVRDQLMEPATLLRPIVDAVKSMQRLTNKNTAYFKRKEVLLNKQITSLDNALPLSDIIYAEACAETDRRFANVVPNSLAEAQLVQTQLVGRLQRFHRVTHFANNAKKLSRKGGLQLPSV
ncbi:hypothetical protein HDV00_007558 [Rhizophlyctis rosea]|nr:hypothetical protein HDV00_007558 [Rhizophlyctis rosea]